MKISGTIRSISEIHEGKGRFGKWTRRDIVIEQENKYKTRLCLCVWDKTLINRSFALGQRVTFEIELESRNYNNKWYTQLIVKAIISPANGHVAILQTVAGKSKYVPKPSNHGEWDDDFDVDDGYSRQELDDMYKNAFENDAQWEWNID